MNKSRIPVPAAVSLATLITLSAGLVDARPAFAAGARGAASDGGPVSSSGVALVSSSGVAPVSPSGVAPVSPSADQAWESVLVIGRGEVVGTPDTLTTEFSVEASAATVAEALTRATAAASRMRDALVRGGV